MTLVVAALLTIGAVAFILLVRQKDIPEDQDSSLVRPLEEHKARIYEGLRDLQFEFRLGKLSEPDYQASKAELQKELNRVMKRLEAAGAGQPEPAPPPEPKEKPEPQPTAAKCPHCGAQFKEQLKFCGECGKPMSGGVA